MAWELVYLGKRSTWRQVDPATAPTAEPDAPRLLPTHYARRFEQGAVLYPQTLLVVRAEGVADRSAASVRVITDPAAAREAKKCKAARVNHVVETSNLYLTAAGDHILPYALSSTPSLVILPTLSDPGEPSFRLVGPDELRRAGRVRTASWLDWAEQEWKNARKQGDDTKPWQRLNYLSRLTSQAKRERYLVIYAAAGKRPVAACIDSAKPQFPFRGEGSYLLRLSPTEECAYCYYSALSSSLT